jgi:hypothetical protein
VSPGLASKTVGPSTADVPASRPMQPAMNSHDGLPGWSTAVSVGDFSWMMSEQPVPPPPSSLVKR